VQILMEGLFDAAASSRLEEQAKSRVEWLSHHLRVVGAKGQVRSLRIQKVFESITNPAICHPRIAPLLGSVARSSARDNQDRHVEPMERLGRKRRFEWIRLS